MEILQNPSYLETIIKKYNIASCFEDISRFQAGLKLIRFPKGTYLYSRPEHRRYAYFLITGKLQIHATMENGRQMLVRCCDEFIFFGDMELLGYQTSSNMTETMTECLFLALDITRGKAELLEDKKFLRFANRLLSELISRYLVDPSISAIKSGVLRLDASIIKSENPDFNFVQKNKFNNEIDFDSSSFVAAQWQDIVVLICISLI